MKLDEREWCWACHTLLGMGDCADCEAFVFVETPPGPWCEACRTEAGCGTCAACTAVDVERFLDEQEVTR